MAKRGKDEQVLDPVQLAPLLVPPCSCHASCLSVAKRHHAVDTSHFSADVRLIWDQEVGSVGLEL
eukprot:1002258-Amphidinium_carterae.2